MNNNDFKVGILLATYNRAHLIGETLDSIIAQTFRNWECIIVDDCSSDNTKEVIESYIKKDGRFSYHLKIGDYKKGLSGTRNYGLDIAKKRGAEFIQFFDDDDIMHPKKLELQLAPFQKDPVINFTVCKFEKLVESEDNWRVERPDFVLKFSHLGDAILTGKMKMNSLGPLWKANFILNYRFDEDLSYAEEWELYTRIGYRYPLKYEIVDEYLFQYRKHPETLTLGEDKNYERRKSSAVSRIKIYEYLTRNRLHTKKSILFLANTFLLYAYNPKIVKSLLQYSKEIPDFSSRLKLYLRIGILMGRIYRKMLVKLANYT